MSTDDDNKRRRTLARRCPTALIEDEQAVNHEKLERHVFETRRELEFFTKKELMMQIGFDENNWPIALVKELTDNALDACEVAGITPDVELTGGDDYFAVRDNGPGLPESTMARSMDYMVRVSDKAYYVSPTRGQMGNALKALWAAGFVANGSGAVEVNAYGKHHQITVALDRIAQTPKLTRAVTESVVKNGSVVKVHWPDSSGLLGMSNDGIFYNDGWTARRLVEAYAAFNPHATFHLNGEVYKLTDPDWQKWAPDEPTSPHWYTPQTLRDLIAAYVAEERRRGEKVKTVRAFVSEFRGLTSTIKQKEITADWSGVFLQDLVIDDDIDMAFVEKLLARMKAASKPVNPSVLGIIGEHHLTRWLINHGRAAEKSIKYERKMDTDEDGMPYVVEVAFGVHKENADGDPGRILVTGMNWSPALGTPIPTLNSLIAEMRIDIHDPISVIVHLARPRFEFVDRGKTRVDW